MWEMDRKSKGNYKDKNGALEKVNIELRGQPWRTKTCDDCIRRLILLFRAWNVYILALIYSLCNYICWVWTHSVHAGEQEHMSH